MSDTKSSNKRGLLLIALVLIGAVWAVVHRMQTREVPPGSTVEVADVAQSDSERLAKRSEWLATHYPDVLEQLFSRHSDNERLDPLDLHADSQATLVSAELGEPGTADELPLFYSLKDQTLEIAYVNVKTVEDGKIDEQGDTASSEASVDDGETDPSSAADAVGRQAKALANSLRISTKAGDMPLRVAYYSVKKMEAVGDEIHLSLEGEAEDFSFHLRDGGQVEDPYGTLFSVFSGNIDGLVRE